MMGTVACFSISLVNTCRKPQPGRTQSQCTTFEVEALDANALIKLFRVCRARSLIQRPCKTNMLRELYEPQHAPGCVSRRFQRTRSALSAQPTSSRHVSLSGLSQIIYRHRTKGHWIKQCLAPGFSAMAKEPSRKLTYPDLAHTLPTKALPTSADPACHLHSCTSLVCNFRIFTCQVFSCKLQSWPPVASTTRKRRGSRRQKDSP